MVDKRLLAFAVLSAGAAVAHAADAERRPGYLAKLDERFRHADKNGDGGLTRSEAGEAGLHRIVDHFDRIDVNSDGKVTRDEMRTLLRNRLAG